MSGGSLGPWARRWARIASTAASSSDRDRAIRRLPGVGIQAGARSGMRAMDTTSPRAVRVASARRSAVGPSSWPNRESPTTSRARVMTSASMSTTPPWPRSCRRVDEPGCRAGGVLGDPGDRVRVEGRLEDAAVLAPHGVVAGQQAPAGHPGQRAVLDRVLRDIAGTAHQHHPGIVGVADQVGRGRRDRELHHVAVDAPLLGQEREGVIADASHGAQHVPAGRSRGSGRGPTVPAWASGQVSVPSGRSRRVRSAPTRGARSGRPRCRRCSRSRPAPPRRSRGCAGCARPS